MGYYLDMKKVIVKCPECGTSIVIDSATGAILEHKKKVEKKDLDQFLEELERKKEEREQLFKQAQDEIERREEILEEKFKIAREKADEIDDLIRPFDLD